MSLLSLTCKNQSHVHTQADTHTVKGSLPDRGQPLSWRKRVQGKEGREEQEKSERQPCRLQRVEE